MEAEGVSVGFGIVGVLFLTGASIIGLNYCLGVLARATHFLKYWTPTGEGYVPPYMPTKAPPKRLKKKKEWTTNPPGTPLY